MHIKGTDVELTAYIALSVELLIAFFDSLRRGSIFLEGGRGRFYMILYSILL